MRKLVYSLFALFSALVIFLACADDLPENPYDSVNYPTDQVQPDTLDPTGFASIHKNILFTKCAMPACHDGAFEPDYRTMQSAYATLVYHSTIKDSPNKEYEFRVKPGDVANSWLYERLITDDEDLGQMPLYAPPLSTEELGYISTWITNGAKDAFGNAPKYPNKEPSIDFFVALSPDFQTNYSDNRVNGVAYNPFIAPKDSNMLIVVLVEDDSTSLDQLQVNQLKISPIKDDFSNAQIFDINYVDLGQNGQFRIATVNTQNFAGDDVYYMQPHFNDGDHAQDTFFPEPSDPDVYKTYWSFYLP